MITKLTFYTTEGCHLCEEAHLLLLQLQRQYPEKFQIEMVDIATSDELVEQYGYQIPVLSEDKRGHSLLCWPFDYAGLLTYLELMPANTE